MNTIQEDMLRIGKRAKLASTELAKASTKDKNNALQAMANAIRAQKDAIINANAKDVAAGKEKGLDAALIDRLALDEKRIESMASGIESIITLDDPVGKITSSWDRPNGLQISRMSVPLGVIGVIYESRPNVTADAGALCLKAGNACILRGGSESFHSSNLIGSCLHAGLKEVGLPEDAIQLVPTTDRSAVGEMLSMNEYIDIIVPRGGKGLCKRVQDESTIPTLQHLDGNCHTYVHESANIDMALDVIHNAKLRRTGICGATESLVIDQTIAEALLPKLIEKLEGCEIRGDQHAVSIDHRIVAANDEDWDMEYLDHIVSVKIIDGLHDAIDFVNAHSSHHTDCIIAEDQHASDQFLRHIDSAIVMHNTSTQFADGGEFGMGAEIGIATGKLHARGPVGVEQLTTFKYLVEGQGQTRPL